MGKTTDNLIKLANDVVDTQPGREMDMLLTTGERIVDGAAVHGARRPRRRRSELHRQPGRHHHRHRRTARPRSSRSRATGCATALADGKVCVVAGFQGVSTDKEITTLGRGGSDTTAVALAAALGADSCEIYTDVTGVFTADPRIVPQARKLPTSTSTRCSRWPAPGSKVLALRSVEFARNHNVPLHVRSSFTWEPGTWVTSEEPAWKTRSSPASSPTSARPRSPSLAVPDRPGISAALFEPLAAANVNVDMIVQNTSKEGTHRHQLHDAEGRHGRRRADRRPRGRTRSVRRASTHDADIAKISARRRRHEDPPGHRRTRCSARSPTRA